MARHHLLVIALAAILVTSCTTFTPYRGNAIVEGKGGTIRVVKGIDFWENGEPDRKYRILGVIDNSSNEGWFYDMLKDGAIAKIARERGGDAVILSGSSREFHGVDFAGSPSSFDIENISDLRIGAKYKRITKFVVVKYIFRESRQYAPVTVAEPQ
ncbi:MAG: hypothetical protein QF535_13090 [Anaerolineales bacterium]|jgi:hypothetical protein|nr:hypothetical protein [Anaerolineales bacterium]|tara:strand:+ start:101 stop:568 length:468 start_codon:yes stop_codon:yes gene_type:complete